MRLRMRRTFGLWLGRESVFIGGCSFPFRWVSPPSTAVILGALLVGDSVRGSLHYLATDRLGDFDSIMLAPRFFDRKVIDDWKQPSSIGGDTKPLPMITFPKATIAFTSTQDKTERTKRQAGNAMILGITPDYWSYGEPLLKEPIKADEIVVNEALAEELDVREGDKLTVRLPSQSAVPADNPLGRRESDTVNLPGLKVVKIIPNRSIGRFDLRSNQRPAMNAFVSIEAVQNALDRPGEINSIFLEGRVGFQQRATSCSQTRTVANRTWPNFL